MGERVKECVFVNGFLSPTRPLPLSSPRRRVAVSPRLFLFVRARVAVALFAASRRAEAILRFVCVRWTARLHYVDVATEQGAQRCRFLR